MPGGESARQRCVSSFVGTGGTFRSCGVACWYKREHAFVPTKKVHSGRVAVPVGSGRSHVSARYELYVYRYVLYVCMHMYIHVCMYTYRPWQRDLRQRHVIYIFIFICHIFILICLIYIQIYIDIDMSCMYLYLHVSGREI